MRIIAGELGGMRLLAPKGDHTRPTLGKVRESLFMILSGEIEGAVALDLFAGAGALGLEALSRGAEEAHFVEGARAAIDALHANVKHLKVGPRAKIIRGDALRFLGGPPPARPYTLVLIDPPYGRGLAQDALAKLGARAAEWLAPSATVVAQVGRRDPLEESHGPLRRFKSRDYGETRVEFFAMDAPAPPGLASEP